MFTIDTHRLCIREMRMDDFDQFYRLRSDPHTMRYIRKPETDPAAVRSSMESWYIYGDQNHPMGVMVAETKENGQFIGYCVLRHVDFTPGNDLEIGYTLAPEAWGKGYATEIARALINYAFEGKLATELVAFTHPENAASQHVLAKCGFTLVGQVEVYGTTGNKYVLQVA
jgi:RimJ/RimL family protein N-acetyltransferase